MTSYSRDFLDNLEYLFCLFYFPAIHSISGSFILYQDLEAIFFKKMNKKKDKTSQCLVSPRKATLVDERLKFCTISKIKLGVLLKVLIY